MWHDLHQGAGLLGFAPGPGIRLLPVLSHPAATLELEVLWQLAASLQRRGYATLVLDAGAQESVREPGLMQWLDTQAGVWPDRGQELAVVPAAQGVAALVAEPREQALAVLARAVAHFSFVLLYGQPAEVAALWGDGPVSPLVINVPGDAALVRSYAILKEMALRTELRCTVAAVAWLAGSGLPAAHNTVHLLQQRCQEWLGASMRVAAVDGSDEQAFGALALQLMEGSCTLHPVPGQEFRQRARASWPAITRYHEYLRV